MHITQSNKFAASLFIMVFLASYWMYSTLILKGPDPYYREYDPEMNYFMNSLMIFKGMPYYYTDHPGTPMEIIGTVLLGFTYPFFKNLRSNFLETVRVSPILFVAVIAVIYLFSYVLHRLHYHFSEKPGKWALGLGLTIQCIFLLLMALKHPGERFLLPLAASIPVFYLVIMDILSENLKFYLLLGKLLVVVSIIAVGLLTLKSLRSKKMGLLQTRMFETQARLAGKKRNELFILWLNVTYSYCPPCLYGDFYTYGTFTEEAEKLCPNQVIFFFYREEILYHGIEQTIEVLPWDILITRQEMLARNPAWKEKGVVKQYPNGVTLLINKE